jgi:RNA:NAD 2'-phosphotransferase (TPT1/KptA family)
MLFILFPECPVSKKPPPLLPKNFKRMGMRHGRPVIFAIDAAAMHGDEFTFYRSDNGVWLVDHVPPEYLTQC